MVQYQDYYKILGVPRTADTAEIQKAFRKLARKYHPDVNKEKGAEDKFKQINEAQEVLCDAEKRRLYDQFGADWKAGQEFRPPPGYESAGHSRRRGGRGFDFKSSGGAFDFGGDASFSDFFKAFFAGHQGSADPFQNLHSAAGSHSHSHVQQPSEAELEVSIEEIYFGSKKEVGLRASEQDQHGRQHVRTKQLAVKIPPTVRNGSVIRLAGQGAAGGDLLIRLKVLDTPKIRIEESGLVVSTDLPAWDAALGGKVQISYFGEHLLINVPPGIQTGQRLRLKGKGLMSSKGSGREDAFLEINIVVPRHLSEAQREAFEKLASLAKP